MSTPSSEMLQNIIRKRAERAALDADKSVAVAATIPTAPTIRTAPPRTTSSMPRPHWRQVQATKEEISDYFKDIKAAISLFHDTNSKLVEPISKDAYHTIARHSYTMIKTTSITCRSLNEALKLAREFIQTLSHPVLKAAAQDRLNEELEMLLSDHPTSFKSLKKVLGQLDKSFIQPKLNELREPELLSGLLATQEKIQELGEIIDMTVVRAHSVKDAGHTEERAVDPRALVRA